MAHSIKLFLSGFALSLICASATAQEKCTVEFDLNYDSTEKISPIEVRKGNALPRGTKPVPEREGYRFSGWYSSPECQPEQEWLFGTNSLGFYMPATDSMTVEKSMTLYARWTYPVPVRTAEDLDKMRNDLYGWYILENDIDLSHIENWVPVGEYEGHYEFADGEWWSKAFKGMFDGNGHTIKGLKITQLLTDKTALFGAVANGEIFDLNLVGSHIEFAGDRPYVAPLVGVLKKDDRFAAAIRNCNVTGSVIKVRTTSPAWTFLGATGLCGGAWNGTIENCKVSGTMELDIAGAGGGELYVGAILGEAYNETIGCVSDFDIEIRFNTVVTDKMTAYIGGLQASSTNVDSSRATGKITVSGNPGNSEIFIGGISGSQRYGTVKNCSTAIDIMAKDMNAVKIGGILGEFNTFYGMIGAMFNVNETSVTDCIASGKIRTKKVKEALIGEVAGAGIPEKVTQMGATINYSVRNCIYSPKKK